MMSIQRRIVIFVAIPMLVTLLIFLAFLVTTESQPVEFSRVDLLG